MKKQNITTFEEAVNYLYDVPRFTTKNTIEDTKEYLQKLGSPDTKMKIIHVAGTNGKGSVCAYLRHILEAAGYKTAVFTSPHLVDIRERFLVKGQMIEKQVFLDAFLEIYNSLDGSSLKQEIVQEQQGKDAIPALTEEHIRNGSGVYMDKVQTTIHTKLYHPTFFEYLFFMAMLIFSKEDIDYCILETGLGGRLDATNAVEQKELSVITRIGLDHVEYLGNTIAQIAGEKAGIIHEGAPVVFSDVEPEATEVFLKQASKMGVSAHGVSRNDYAFLNFKNKSIDFSIRSEYYGYVGFSLNTIARYQMENAALAVRAIEVLDKEHTITVQQLQEGVEACFWQGRMEEILPEVYVDGAHNEDGIRAFLETVREDGCEQGRSLLFSVVQDKDYEHMIQMIAESDLFDRIAIAHMHTGRAASLERLQELFDGYPGCRYSLYTKVDTALQELLKDKRPWERIYIAGSLYLVGEIKESLRHD